MKITSQLAVLAGFAGIIFSAHAQQNYNTSESAQPPPPRYHDHDHDYELYHPCEFDIDGSLIGVLHEYDFNNGGLHRRNYRFGGDVGASVFFTKYIGIGADASALTTHNPTFVDTAMGNLIFRVPIANTGLAPYLIGGAGCEFERVNQLVGGGGVGLEFRPVPHFGFFIDARYFAAAKTPDYGEGRAGVRISF